MNKISSHTFKHTIKDIYKHTESRKFCFVIGAGASFKSGIPTGGELAKNWFKEITERYSEAEVEKWTEEVKLDRNDLAVHYGSIYRKRFETDKTSGYEFLVQAMRNAKPSFGHIVLAQVLAKAPGNCVLTTNFDSLIETSIYQFTDRTPLVCGHESLSGYARPSSIHPLIIKIHRDLLLAPKSDIDEITKLDEGWKEPLDHIFSSHIPIVIGYGGNDGSLMSYIEKMNKPSNFFWCGLKDEVIPVRVQRLIEQMGGSFVEIHGFDELMQELLWVFDEIKPIREELDAITKSRIETVDKQLDEINRQSKQIETNNAMPKKELSAFEYSTMAENEPDFEKRKAIYLEALEHFPNTVWLWGEFTYFLQFIKKDYNNLEEYYKKALAVNPEHEGIIGNYAGFLHEIKGDYENAQKYYLKALAIDPKSRIFNGNYAIFLEDIIKDYEAAQKYYLISLDIDSENARSNGNYAVFLKNKKNDYLNAEKYYIKSLAIEPENHELNANYGFYLESIKKDYDNAEAYYVKSVAICPTDDFNNSIYANFLFRIRKDYDNAQKYFLKSLHIDPESARVNGNYADFLKVVKGDYINAQKHYLKELETQDSNANTNCNYAGFLLALDKKNEAESYLTKAFQLNKNDKNAIILELLFYQYAHYRELMDDSQKKLEELLEGGVTSIGWNFDLNIETAIKNGHPAPDKLRELADRITKPSS